MIVSLVVFGPQPVVVWSKTGVFENHKTQVIVFKGVSQHQLTITDIV